MVYKIPEDEDPEMKPSPTGIPKPVKPPVAKKKEPIPMRKIPVDPRRQAALKKKFSPHEEHMHHLNHVNHVNNNKAKLPKTGFKFSR